MVDQKKECLVHDDRPIRQDRCRARVRGMDKRNALRPECFYRQCRNFPYDDDRYCSSHRHSITAGNTVVDYDPNQAHHRYGQGRQTTTTTKEQQFDASQIDELKRHIDRRLLDVQTTLLAALETSKSGGASCSSSPDMVALRRELAQVRAEKRALEVLAAAAEKEAQRLRVEHAQLQAMSDEAQLESQRLKSERNDALEAMSGATEQEARQEAARLQAENEALQAAAAVADNEAERIKADNEALQLALAAEGTSASKAAQRKADAAQIAVERLEQENESLRAAAAIADSEVARLTRLGQSRVSGGNNEEELASRDARLAQQNEELNQRAEALAAREQELSNVRAQLQQVTANLQEKTNEISNLTAELAQSRKDIADFQVNLDKARQQLAATEARCARGDQDAQQCARDSEVRAAEFEAEKAKLLEADKKHRATLMELRENNLIMSERFADDIAVLQDRVQAMASSKTA